MDEGKGGWITKIMEYDIEIKPTKLIKGWAVCENMADATHMIAVIGDEEATNQENDWIK